MAPKRQGNQYFYEAPNDRLAQLLKRLRMSYEEAKVVLLIAEHGAFGGELIRDQFDSMDFDVPLAGFDQKASLDEFVQKLARSQDPAIQAAVDRILDAKSKSKDRL